MAGQCLTMWIGEALGPVERACLKSVVRLGHRLALYSYASLDVPEGVELRDGAEILPLAMLDERCGGRVAFFADWFRYALLRRELGAWVDADLYLLAPLDMESPHLFGEQSPGELNNAVLRLPADSPLLAELLAIFEQPGAMPWLPWRARLRSLLAGADLAIIPWGSTGPHALTALARRLGLSALAEPPERFYPVSWQEASWLLEPGVQAEDVARPGTVAVHLWNECIKGFKDRPAPHGSFLARLQREGA